MHKVRGMTDHYDFIVIGGGSAGYAGASAAVGLGMRTLLVEKQKRVKKQKRVRREWHLNSGSLGGIHAR